MKASSVKAKAVQRALRQLAWIQGFATANNLEQTYMAASKAYQLHQGQKRDDGQPYVSHPIAVCMILICHGIKNDELLAAILLHDVLEDTKIIASELKEMGFLPGVVKLVSLLSKINGMSDREYYAAMGNIPEAVVGKAADVAHNIGNMATVFTTKRLRRYVAVVEKFVMPMIRRTRHENLEYRNLLVSLEFLIESSLVSLKEVIRLREQLNL